MGHSHWLVRQSDAAEKKHLGGFRPLRYRAIAVAAALLCFVVVLASQSTAADDPPVGNNTSGPLKVCATTPTLASLVEEIGGDQVSLSVLSDPETDPHHVGPNPEFRRAMSDADIYIRNGVGLEDGWTYSRRGPRRSPAVLNDGSGYIDAGLGIEILARPRLDTPPIAGDMHKQGNPHYLLDPLNALKVAAKIELRLSSLRPDKAAVFLTRSTDFKRRLDEAMVGDKLAALYSTASLVELSDRGKLDEFLTTLGHQSLLGGWLGKLSRYRGTRIVCESRLFTYFANRFGLVTEGRLDQVAGVDGGDWQLRELAEVAADHNIGVMLADNFSSASRHNEFAKRSGSTIVVLEHEPGRLPKTKGYIEMMNENIERLALALGAADAPY